MTELEKFFDAARREEAEPSADLTARILADAERTRLRAVTPMATKKSGRWARVAAFFGGSVSLAGMGTAAAAGFYLGLVQPLPLQNLTDALMDQIQPETLELMPGIDAFLIED